MNSQEKQNESSLPIVIGHVVSNDTSSHNSAEAQAIESNEPHSQPTLVSVSSEPLQPHEDIGVCRSCGREFVRPPGTHDGMAQYFRCQNCVEWKTQDYAFFFTGCTMS